jgi:hypothetical protein
VALIAATLLLAIVDGAESRSFTRVVVPSLDRDAAGAPVALPALLLLPMDRRRQGIPARRGTARMQRALLDDQGTRGSPGGTLMASADLLLSEGYALLFPDSFRAARAAGGLHDQAGGPVGCAGEAQARRARRARLSRAAARHRARPDRTRRLVARRQHGARDDQRTRSRRECVSRAARRAAVLPRRRRVLSGCPRVARRGRALGTAVPTRVLIGELDDWTPPKACVDLARRPRRAASRSR